MTTSNTGTLICYDTYSLL